MRMGMEGEGAGEERNNGHGRQKNQMVGFYTFLCERERERSVEDSLIERRSRWWWR